MAKTVALVSCVSKKKSIESPARSLYTSCLFIKSIRFADQIADEWYILSAKYGLVHPDTIIAPYDLTLKTMRKETLIQWAAGIMQTLEGHLVREDKVIFLAGETYRKYLIDPIAHMGCHIDIPMKNKRIGQQMQWLNKQLKGVSDGTSR